jgi:predicted acetyltransferase
MLDAPASMASTGLVRHAADLEVRRAEYADKDVLRRLLEFYRYDFSVLDGRDVDEHGIYGYRYLDHYWTDERRHPFLFRVDGSWAGFALVHEGPPHEIREFFVLRKYRRSGIGSRAARELFSLFPGEWSIHELHGNEEAMRFWRAAIPFAYSEDSSSGGTTRRFCVESHVAT